MPETKTQRVMDDLTARIAAGQYPPGTRLPSRRELAEQYGVSEQTIRIATDRLREAGRLESVPRGGLYVRLGR